MAFRLRISVTLVVAASAAVAFAQTGGQDARQPPASLTTPDNVKTRIGTLEFKDGAPTKKTLDEVYDNLDRTHAFRAFVDTMQAVSLHALSKGLRSIGAKDNEAVIFSELMDSKSLFLTANADTVYALGILDLSKGPMVLEVPPKFLGAIDDYWFRWVIDIGFPGVDRGEGGRYLIVPAGYEGPLPEGGFVIARPRTVRLPWFGRSFLENKSDPKPPADTIRKFTKIYPYKAGGIGSPVADFLAGKAPFNLAIPTPPPTVFHEASGKVMNTVLPSDFSYYEMLNEVVQQEPATSFDPELMGPLAAIGIIKGKPFNRMSA